MGELLRAQIRDLDPGYFALVMATGIVSAGVAADAATVLSQALLAVAIVAYVLLLAAHVVRLATCRREFLADTADPARAFSFFTVVAASNVLGARLAGDAPGLTVALLAAALAAWAVLSYGMTLGLVTRHGARSALTGANGTWFLWTVSAQSVAVVCAALPWRGPALTSLAVAFWSVGVLLFLLTSALVLIALLGDVVEPATLGPPYWIFMGATAISVLAGAQVVRLPADPVLSAVRPVVSGLSVMLWAFGTWLIPLLAGMGVWRHGMRRVPLRYEPGWWGFVFPIGMYGVGSGALGMALGVPWLVTLGRYEAWVALGCWIAVFAAMLWRLLSLGRAA